MVFSGSGSSGNNIEFLWDEFWRNQGPKESHSWAKKRMLSILSNYIKKGMVVLDAGCGSGFFSDYFISCGCQVYSLDYSKEAIAIAKEITKNMSSEYIKGNIIDGRGLVGIDARFDVIFTDGLLEHYHPALQDRVINNLKHLKKEKGYLINFVPNRLSLWSLVRPLFIDIEERPLSMNGFIGLHRRNGLKVTSYGGINVLPFRVSPERLLGRCFGMLLYCVAV